MVIAMEDTAADQDFAGGFQIRDVAAHDQLERDVSLDGRDAWIAWFINRQRPPAGVVRLNGDWPLCGRQRLRRAEQPTKRFDTPAQSDKEISNVAA